MLFGQNTEFLNVKAKVSLRLLKVNVTHFIDARQAKDVCR